MAVGGAAYLVAKAIKSAKVVGFADLGMEAIYEFDVEDMPVTVPSIRPAPRCMKPARRKWQVKIGKIPHRQDSAIPARRADRLPAPRTIPALTVRSIRAYGNLGHAIALQMRLANCR